MSAGPTSPGAIQLEFNDHSLLPVLFGDHDRNLARIEQRLRVSLACFGNRVRIDGEPDAADAARATLESLYRQLEAGRGRGRPARMLDMATVDAAMQWARDGGGAAAGFGDPETIIQTWKRPVAARSPNQARYVRALRRHPLVFALGPAGTGKTYLAVAVAVAMLKERRVDRLVLSRPAVEAGERLGFLPGDMRDKVDPYLRPLYDALYDMMPADQVERRIAGGEIEIAPLAFMRGRTLSHAFIILDEAQNTTATQMKMFLTRIGAHSRMTVNGDLSQIDLPPGVGSGLRDSLDVLEGTEGIASIAFSGADVVRHPLVGRIVDAYDRRDRSRVGAATGEGGP